MRHPSLALAIGVPLCLMAASAVALSIESIYLYMVDGAVTGDNGFQGSDGKWHWDVDAGGDDHASSFGLESGFAFHGSDLTNGYHGEIVSDGQKKGGPNRGSNTFHARVDPTNGNGVEFALDYTKLGLTLDDILDLESVDVQAIKGDPHDPQNQKYPWNETYTAGEVGSPYASPGLDNVYGLDALRVHVTPEPSTVAMVGMGCLGLGLFGSHSRAKRIRRGTR